MISFTELTLFGSHLISSSFFKQTCSINFKIFYRALKLQLSENRQIRMVCACATFILVSSLFNNKSSFPIELSQALHWKVQFLKARFEHVSPNSFHFKFHWLIFNAISNSTWNPSHSDFQGQLNNIKNCSVSQAFPVALPVRYSLWGFEWFFLHMFHVFLFEKGPHNCSNRF